MPDLKPMPVPGDHEAAQAEGARGAGGAEGAGQSGGGAYPSPHEDGAGAHGSGHGGQSEIAYHGPGQLGDDVVDGDAPPGVAQGG